MCDYSLEVYRSEPAVTGEQYTLERFPSGSMGFTSGRNCDTAMCVPAGARLQLAGIAEPIRATLGLSLIEEAVMTRLEGGPHKDGVRLSDGREISLQALNVGVTALVLAIGGETIDLGDEAARPAPELVQAD